MHRFYLPPEMCRREELVLSGRESHHARSVLRLKPGDAATVVNGRGDELECEVIEAKRRDIKFRVIDHRRHPPPSARVTLIQGIAKNRAMDWIIQKATELGVSQILPILTQHSSVSLSSDEAAKKKEKWEATAIEAIKQCTATWLPHIERPTSLQCVAMTETDADLNLVAALQPDAQHPSRPFAAFRRDHDRLPDHCRLWVGPEGDFSPTELDIMRSKGHRLISLGDRVLRTETAALCALSVINHELTAAYTGTATQR